MKKTPLQIVTRNARAASAGLGTALLVMAMTAACSSHQATATARNTNSAAPGGGGKSVTSTVLHWGAFFGESKSRWDMQTSPVAVTVPGKVAQVGTSNSTQYALLTDGTLYAWGLGTQGELGNGGRVDSFTAPVRVAFPAGVKIAYIPTDVMPYNTGLAVDTAGNAWGWGGNAGGELCLGNRKVYTTPVKLPFSRVTTLAGASGHAVYDAGGTVYACGLNRQGVLGNGSTADSNVPVKVTGLDGSNVSTLVAAFDNAGALTKDGTFYNWGYNADGQLGNGHLGRPSDVPVKVKLPHRVTQVAEGGSIWHNGQTIVLLSDGSLWGWGDGKEYQLGTGKRGNQAVPAQFHAPAGVTYQTLATSGLTSYAITAGGDVYAWGSSHAGQVGNGQTHSVKRPALVASGATGISATANNVAINVPQSS